MPRVDINPLPRHPVFTPRQAIRYALDQVDDPDKDYTGLCLHFCAWTYGFKNSGVHNAALFWRLTPDSLKRTTPRPPRGSIVFYSGGSREYGHVGVVVKDQGQILVASTDIRRRGKIDVVPLGEVEQRWGMRYEGWMPPYFGYGTQDDRRAPDVYRSEWAWGNVHVVELSRGENSSDSVRRLQWRLRRHPQIPGDMRPEVTGDWDTATTVAVRWWQNAHGYDGGRGRSIGNVQANRLFGWDYFVKPE